MDRNLLYRGLFILGIAAAMAFFAYPPDQKINLGLDLQGGMHLVLRVKTDDALDAETENTIDTLRGELETRSVTADIDQLDGTTFEASGVPSDQDDDLRTEVLERYMPGWEMNRSGDTLRFSLTSQEASSIRQLSVNQAQETIRNRVDKFGVAEPIIHGEGIGSDRIVVQLPGVDDPERVKAILQSTAFLELRLVVAGTNSAPTRQDAIDNLPGGQLTDEIEIIREEIRDANKRPIGEEWWAIEAQRVITGRDLKTSRTSTGEFGEPSVSFTLTREGGERFAEVTGANIGRGLAVVLDEQVQSVATIRDRIRDQGVINGSFTLQEVQDLVTTLRSGALPAGLEILEERTVGPTLGRDSIEKGRQAGMIGGICVVLLMLLVYRLTGVNAVGVLLLNIVMVFGALAQFGATLTLPGIAGIVLTIGMAVDANVLIFERIREELRSGRTVKSAIEAGFGKALSSILDANVTTLIAAMFLFMFGTGPIRGFAVTLSVGIFCSVFTAVFVSRFLFDLRYSNKQRVDELSI
ncbi:MAG: protein translocase subunit SecD [Acidobacteriota bacterium]